MTISLLRQVAITTFEDYDPATMIEAVNSLQALTKAQAIAEIEASQQSRPATPYGLFWMLRVLFDVPEPPGFPPLRLGQSTPPPPDAKTLPRFPMVVVQDIPFLAIRGYVVGGKAEPLDIHLTYYRTHGTLRAQPLTPPADLSGVREEFVRVWSDAYGEGQHLDILTLIDAQIARLGG